MTDGRISDHAKTSPDDGGAGHSEPIDLTRLPQDPPSVAVYHLTMRSSFRWILLPIIGIPLGIWGLRALSGTLDGESSIAWYWYILVIGGFLLFPLVTWIATRFVRYTVTPSHLVEERGLLNKKSSEIRIRDIRNITVDRSFTERLLGIGDISFSSSAGDEAEVTFNGISRPAKVKALVQAHQHRLDTDGKA